METQSITTETTHRQMDVHLNLIRGLAVLGVVLGHARNIFFVSYSDSSSFLVKLFVLSAGFGTQMVMVFFVLSGYCIAASILYEKNTWTWSKYLINRFVRLYVVLAPALLLTLFWDYLGIFISQNGAIYQGLGPQNVVSNDVLKNINFSVFLGNFFFLQDIFTPCFGSNTPLWSLSYECWYYIAFPLLLLIFSASASLNKKLLYVFLLVSIAYVFWVFIYLFPVWLFGAFLAFIPRNNFLRSRIFFWIFLFIAFVFLATCLMLSRFSITDGLMARYSIGLASSFLIYVLLHDATNRQSYYAKITAFLANMSYTIYLTHLPFLVFLYAVFIQVGRWPFGVGNIFKFTGVLFLTFFYCYFVSRFTESRTSKVKTFFYSNFLNKKSDLVF